MTSAREPACGRRRRTATRCAVLLLALTLTGAYAFGSIWGAFTSKASDPGNQVTAASDWAAPTVSTLIQKTTGGIPGYIHQGGAYRFYANVSDTGNPASGVATVTGNVATISSGKTSAALSSGSFTVFGQSYNYGTASLTANASRWRPARTATRSPRPTTPGTPGRSRATGRRRQHAADRHRRADRKPREHHRARRARRHHHLHVQRTDRSELDRLGLDRLRDDDAVVHLNSGGGGRDTVTIYSATNATQLPLRERLISGERTTQAATSPSARPARRRRSR